MGNPAVLRTISNTSLVLLILINFIIFSLRLSSLLTHGDLFSTTGAEGPVIYSLWKLLNSFPLYEWPDRDNYSYTLYNFAFYHLYGGIINLFGIKDDFLFHARFITFAFSIVGFIVFIKVIETIFPHLHARAPTGNEQLTKLGIGLLFWFGTASLSWWIFAARPDVAALVFVVAGLLFLIISEDDKALFLSASALFFFLAWATKQSMVGIASGVLLYFFITRQFKSMFIFAVPYFGLVGLCLFLGSDVYRANIITASTVHSIDLSQSLKSFAKVWMPNMLFLIPAGWLLMERKRIQARVTLLLITVFVTANVFAFVVLGKSGAAKNHAFEAVLAGALLFPVLLNESATSKKQVGSVLTASVMMIGFCFAQIYFFNQMGKITLASDQDYKARQVLSRFMSGLQKPVFIRDEVLAQPWFATDGKYPAPVIDWSYYKDAKSKMLLEGRGIEEWVEQRRFSTLLLHPNDSLLDLAREGYKIRELPEEIQRLGLLLYVLDQAVVSRDSRR